MDSFLQFVFFLQLTGLHGVYWVKSLPLFHIGSYTFQIHPRKILFNLYWFNTVKMFSEYDFKLLYDKDYHIKTAYTIKLT